MMDNIDERSLKLLARFAVEILAATAEHRPAPAAELRNWPRWFAEMSGVDLDNPRFADGRHLKGKKAADQERPIG